MFNLGPIPEEFENGDLSLWKRIKIFHPHCAKMNLKTQQTSVILNVDLKTQLHESNQITN